jgi:aminoglycoside phosphotransferase (APT) family kinase protein
VLQRTRAGAFATGIPLPVEAELLRVARREGVPVPNVVRAGDADEGLGGAFVIAERVEGETIARRILRDDEYGTARRLLVGQCAEALASIHRIPIDDARGLGAVDQVQSLRSLLDGLGDPHPAFELAFRWLAQSPAPARASTVLHGDFRLGNFIVGADGLRAVLDWELAHIGDPVEDLAWFCVKAWRFGEVPVVAGLGEVDDLLAAYEAAGGVEVDRSSFEWWLVVGTLRWGIICMLQAATHLSGRTPSVELAAIGRRVCETEHDLLELLP